MLIWLSASPLLFAQQSIVTKQAEKRAYDSTLLAKDTTHHRAITPAITLAERSLLLDDYLEQLTENDETMQGSLWEDELEDLANRWEEPLNLNTATPADLAIFPFLTPQQIEQIEAYKYIHGELKTLHELQLIEDWDKQTIDRISPWVCVKPVNERPSFPSLGQLIRYGKHQLLNRFDYPLYRKQGYDDSFLGPKPYHSLRYSFRYPNFFEVGVTAEKDAGEPLFAQHFSKGYGYYSPYLLISNWGIVKTLAVGNYKLNFGYGLVMGAAFRLNKSYSLNTFYRSSTVSKHSSSDEYNYFRGVAATLTPWRQLELTAFYSHRDMAGTLKGDTITSIYKSGLFRSAKEAEKRNAFYLQTTGCDLSYRYRSLKLGFTGIYYAFSRPFEPKRTGYARYALHGKEFYNLGINYYWHTPYLVWSGEAAKGKKGYALFNQLESKPADWLKLQLIHRHYSYHYWSFYSRAFGESSHPQNEKGIYLAAEVMPWARWKLFASADVFESQWWKYRVSKPSTGYEMRFQATFQPNDQWMIYGNYRFKRKERDVADSDTKDKLTLPTYQQNARLRAQMSTQHWQLRTTVDYMQFHQPGGRTSGGRELSRGIMAGQMIKYAFPFGLSATAQAAYFHTDDYDARIYSSEAGLLYTFNSYAYYGKGLRLSANLRYDINPHLMLMMKWGYSVYHDRDTLGSGNDMINSNHKTDLQAQVRLKF